jgi:AhpD family alkylhydroperoxidase
MSDLATQHTLAADPKVTELVALGAAVGSGCEACFRSHFETARTVGLSGEEIVHAVGIARAVRETSADRMLDLAARKLDVSPTTIGAVAPQVAPDQAADACC